MPLTSLQQRAHRGEKLRKKVPLERRAAWVEGFCAYRETCGWTVARGHARSGDREAMAGYLGTTDMFETAVGAFATAYADSNQVDYERLVDAIDHGPIVAEPGV